MGLKNAIISGKYYDLKVLVGSDNNAMANLVEIKKWRHSNYNDTYTILRGIVHTRNSKLT